MTRVMQQLDEEQRQQLAKEWGYEQLGALLPEGVPVKRIVQGTFDRSLITIDVKAMALGLLVPVASMLLGYSWLWYMNASVAGLQQAACWILIGTGYFGVFNIASDAARGALLPPNERGEPYSTQNLIATILMAPSLYSFEAWRLSLLAHFKETNVIPAKEAGADFIAGSWQPLTKGRLAAMGERARTAARLVASWVPILRPVIYSISNWLSSWGGLDLKGYYGPMRTSVFLSWAVPVVLVSLSLPIAVTLGGGLGTWVDCWLAPWLIFHFWLGLITMLQHTAPHIPMTVLDKNGSLPVAGRDVMGYDEAKAAINGTVTVRFPKWIELLIANANYHLPQHFSGVPIPFYHAPAATAALKKKLGPFMSFATINGRLLRNLLEKWQLYDEDRQTYVSFRQAEKELGIAPPGSSSS